MPVEQYTSERATVVLRRVADVAFGLYLILLLGANSVAAAGGPPAWLPLWRLPAAGGEWRGVGVIGLLPLVSMAAWLLHRRATTGLGALGWGWTRPGRPLALLAAVALLSLARSCFGDACDAAGMARLALLIGHGVWVYLYVVNEKPNLFWIVAAIIVLQAGAAIGQFVWQRELGLGFLGEPALDPAVKGVSVVMRGPERWLRGYGLTNHPNTAAGTLVTALLILPLCTPRAGPWGRVLAGLVFALGVAGLLTTLARWAAVCLALGLAVHALPWLRALAAGRRPPRHVVATAGLVALVGVLFLGVYGDAVVGRAVATETPVENRSLWERERDTQIAWRLLATEPWTGVGFGQYVSAARVHDAWAEVVHNTPLLWGAELGVVGLLLWGWLVAAPVLRRGAFSRHAPYTALWLGFWLLGLLYPAPHPLFELRSALLAGLVVGLVALSTAPTGGRPRGSFPSQHG